MKLSPFVALGFSSLFWLSPFAESGILPPLDLKKLSESADVVVVASAGSIKDIGTAKTTMEGREMRVTHKVAKLQPRLFLKGNVASQAIDVDFEVPYEPNGYQGIGITDVGIFFLTSDAHGRFRLTDPYHALVPGGVPMSSLESDVFQNVLRSVEAAALEASRKRSERLESLWLLSKQSDVQIDQSILRLVKDSDKDVALMAASILIAHGNIALLRRVKSDLMKPGLSDDNQSILGAAIRTAIFQPNASKEIIELLSYSPYARIRSAAALASRHIGPESAVKALLRALDDPDEEVRYDAILALVHVTKAYELGVLEEDFKKQENRYILAWKRWARNNGYEMR